MFRAGEGLGGRPAAPAGTVTHSAAAVAIAAAAVAKENLRFIASPPNLRTDRGMTAGEINPLSPACSLPNRRHARDPSVRTMCAGGNQETGLFDA